MSKIRKERLTGYDMLKHATLHAVLLGSLLISMNLFAADDPIEDIHQLTLQWTGLEHQKDLLRENWRGDKPVLEQQLSLLEREIRDWWLTKKEA